MTQFASGAGLAPCPACGLDLPPALRECPSCGALVHAAELTRLAGLAEEAERQGELASALTAWKEALILLPPDAPQVEIIRGRVTRLHERLIAGEGEKPTPKTPGVRESWRNGGVLAALGAMLLKFKTIIILVLSKAKLVLIGLTKLKTLLSMFAFFAVYWAAWGWKFALGFVLSIYIHEMGHVVAARRFGIRASAPVFIPLLGAFILLKEPVRDVRVNARIGLAGPVWGLGAAVAFYLAFLGTGDPLLGAIAGTVAWMNLFNMLPVWTLDGARGFTSLTRVDRWCVVGALGAMTLVLPDQSMLVILTVVTAGVALMGKPSDRSDRPMLVLYLFLAVALTAIGATALPAAHAAARSATQSGF